MKSCQVTDSDKSNSLTKVEFLLKSGFQVIAFFIPLEVGYLVIIVVKFVYKLDTTIIFGTSQNNAWLVYIFEIHFGLDV